MRVHAQLAAAFVGLVVVLGSIAMLPGGPGAAPAEGPASPVDAEDVAAGTVVWEPSDVQVTDPSAQFAGPWKDMFEPSVAINPNDPMEVIAFAIDMSSQNPHPYPDTWSTNRAFRSVDGGLTWTDMGHVQETDTHPVVSSGDPVTLFDNEGRAYFASLATPPGEYRHIYVFRSEDGGATWTDPIDAVPPIMDLDSDTCTSADKQWMGLGDEPGELYITYTRATFQCSLDPGPLDSGESELYAIKDIGIYWVRSDDAGDTWTEPKKLWNGYALGSIPVVTESGAIHVALWGSTPVSTRPCPSLGGTALARLGGGPFGSIVVASSRDDGATWAYHTQSMCPLDLSFHVKPGSYGGGNLLPTFVRDAATDDLHVAYPTYDPVQDRFTLELIGSTDDGATWSAPQEITPGPDEAHLPVLHADNDVLRLTYVTNDDQGFGDVWYRSSTDGGVSWSERTRLSTERMDLNDDPGVGDYNSLSVEGDRIVALWTDARDPGATRIWARVGTLVQGGS